MAPGWSRELFRAVAVREDDSRLGTLDHSVGHARSIGGGFEREDVGTVEERLRRWLVIAELVRFGFGQELLDHLQGFGLGDGFGVAAVAYAGGHVVGGAAALVLDI